VRTLVTSLLLGSLVHLAPVPAATAAKPAIASASEPSAAEEAAAWRVRQGLNFKRNWGVEIINVKPVSSGYMLALRYRVLDPALARIFNDRKAKAYLVDQATNTVLAVPALENIGELRPGATPEAGRIYFMIFGNPGKLVKTGSRISLRVGNLRADNMIVE
jgi:hypothetical protein